MKTNKKVLAFCNEFTLFNHYSIGKVLYLNLVPDCINTVLFKCNNFVEKHQIIFFGCIDVIWLTVINGKSCPRKK